MVASLLARIVRAFPRAWWHPFFDPLDRPDVNTPPLISKFCTLMLLTPVLACDRPSGDYFDPPIEQRPDSRERDSSYQLDCMANPLPTCAPGWTGPECDHACSPGFDECRIKHSCHADGRTLGLSAVGTRLFELPSARPSAQEVADHLEEWISANEAHLGLEDGLTPGRLRIEPLLGTEAHQGQLDLYRFFQYHDAGGHRALVDGDGAIITVEVGPHGATAVKGSIVDPRSPFEHAQSPASANLARRSILQHVHDATGVPVGAVKVDDVGLVAVPGPDVLAWRGVAYVGGQIAAATVLVEADPQAPGHLLPLLRYERNVADGLHDPFGLELTTENLATNVIAAPIEEATVSSLLDGEDLMGSIDDQSGEPQLAAPEVIAIDVLGHGIEQVKEEEHFARYTNAAGVFDATQPSAMFDVQRHYHISKEAHAMVNQLAAGSWDSALSLFHEKVPDPADPTVDILVPKTSEYGSGQFRPRILNANNHAPLGGPSGQAGFGMVEKPHPVPEAYQSPGPGLQSEAVSYIKLPPGSTSASILMHELGHTFDVFLGAGFPRTYAPECPGGCDATCDEDTSDEALPLTETIAQMFALWQLRRIGDVQHDDCAVIGAVMTGAGQGSTLVHHPACMTDADQISLFLREDDPACLDSKFCDKPTHNETDPAQGGTHLCDSTAGYNVTSLFQAWWNMLHGQYCEPVWPFSCSPTPAVAWPLGCDIAGSTVECATTDELAALPFLYALRTNPLTYQDLVDEMATFVACNYGEVAYTWFNQALCDHHLRGCGEPPPMICQTCGNGIREGLEQCDGLDMGGPGLGWVPSCEDEGFGGGTLLCNEATCTYDFSLCEGPWPGSSDEGLPPGEEPEDPGTTSWGDTETSSGPGASDSGGCNCRTDGGGTSSSWVLGAMLLLVRRRRERRIARRSARKRAMSLGLAGLVAASVGIGCGDDPPAVGTAKGGGNGNLEEASSGESGEGLDESGTEGGAGSSGGEEAPMMWPPDSLGPYYLDDSGPLEAPGQYLFTVLTNIELRRDGLFVTYIGCDGIGETTRHDVTFVGAEAHVRPEPGEEYVKLNGAFAEELVFRPGETCEVLETELIEPLYPEFGTHWTWRRGAVYVNDTCSEDDDIWSAAVSPDVPTDCG